MTAKFKGWLFLSLLLLSLLALARVLPVADWLTRFNHRVATLGFPGVLLFIGVYVLATVLLVPGLILTLGGGFAFGLLHGFIAVSIASTLAAALAFLIARFLLRERLVARFQRDARFRALDQAIGKEGWKIIGLLRVTPFVPFNLCNYFYGLTAVKFWPYVLVSWIAMMPPTLVYVYLGAAGRATLQAGAGIQQRDPLEWFLLAAGLAAALIASVFITRLARKALASVTPLDK